MDRGEQPETDVMAYRRQVGARLREARENSGLSLRNVGERLDISHGAIGHWEKGTNPISIDELRRLARLYGTTVLALVADEMSDEDILALAKRQLSDARRPKPLRGSSGKRDGTGG